MAKLTKAFIAKLKKNPTEVLDSLSENEIAEIIQRANYEYYHGKEPLFQDNLFDIIKEYLEEKNPNHPVLKNIGAVVKGDKVKLPYHMASLDKIKTDERVIVRWEKEFSGECVLSDKLDGNSGLLYVKDGEASLYTRGDGTFGQDISHLLPFIKNIPKKYPSGLFAVRGELIISKKDFESVKAKGANARNMVAGVLNAKIPDLELAALTQFVAYELIEPSLKPEAQFIAIKKAGLKPVWNELVSSIDIANLSKVLTDRRQKSEFECDGIVVAHNAIYKRTTENPKHAFAFKSILTMEKAEVIVTKVEWNISKDGYLIPVIIFQPVSLAGVSIQRATGFNGKYIKENNIGPGSKIVIIRSGYVIPYVTDVLSPSETGKPSMPDQKFIWSKSGVDIVLADENDDEVRFKNIEYFFKKLDVKGVSTGVLRKMYDSGFKTVKSIIMITKSQLLRIEGIKQKSADNIYDAINAKSKDIDCVLVMDASNVMGRGLGSKKIKLMTDTIPKIFSERYIPTVDELVKIKSIEKTTAELFIGGLPKYWKFVDENDLGCMLEDKNEEVKLEEQHLKGVSFVFTGFRNKETEAKIVAHGGEIKTSVSKNTSVVVCKDEEAKDSSKVKKALELGVKVLTFAEFKKEYKF